MSDVKWEGLGLSVWSNLVLLWIIHSYFVILVILMVITVNHSSTMNNAIGEPSLTNSLWVSLNTYDHLSNGKMYIICCNRKPTLSVLQENMFNGWAQWVVGTILVKGIFPSLSRTSFSKRSIQTCPISQIRRSQMGLRKSQCHYCRNPECTVMRFKKG